MISKPEKLTRYELENDFVQFSKRMGFSLHHTATYPAYIPPDCIIHYYI